MKCAARHSATWPALPPKSLRLVQTVPRATEGRPVVAKCANSTCGRAFRYLREGRLFRLEPDPAFDSGAEFDHSIEYFWLCEACSDSMTLRLDAQGRIFTEDAEP